MARAIEETERRREKQEAWNKAHGITPTKLNKKITDILEIGGSTNTGKKSSSKNDFELKAAETATEYALMTAPELQKKIAEYERTMQKHAQNLEFEEAARLRDELHQLRDLLLVAL